MVSASDDLANGRCSTLRSAQEKGRFHPAFIAAVSTVSVAGVDLYGAAGARRRMILHRRAVFGAIGGFALGAGAG